MRLLQLTILLVLAGAQLGTAAPTRSQPLTPGQGAGPVRAPAALHVRGPGLKDLDLSMSDLKALPHRGLTVKDKDGKSVTYSGVLVEDILVRAGMVFGQGLRGPKLRDYLLAEGTDGYAVVFALPEISTEFSDRLVILADAADDKPLGGREGPLKIIVSDEKKHARWVRGVTRLSVHTCEAEPRKE